MTDRAPASSPRPLPAASREEGRTLVVAYDLPPTPNAAAQRLFSLVGAVQAAGQGRVHVLTPPGGEAPPGAEVIPFAAAVPHSGQNPLVRLGLEVRLGLALVSQVRAGRYDRVVVSSPLFIPTLLILAWCRFEGVPYLLDIRDPYPAVYVEAGLIRKGGRLDRLLRRAARKMYRGARLVTTATKGLAVEVRGDAPGQTVRARRNGHGGRALMDGGGGQADGLFRVACHGNFGAFQDVAGLIELVDRVLSGSPSVRFQFVGRGDGLERLRQARGELGWDGRLTVSPPLPAEQLWQALQGSHLGLSIRGDDGISRRAFPVRITDYLELGVPVVVIPHSEAGRIVERLGLGRAFASSDLDGAARFVLELASSPERYRAYATRIRNWAPFFSRERTLRRFQDDVRDAFPGWVRANSSSATPGRARTVRAASSLRTRHRNHHGGEKGPGC